MRAASVYGVTAVYNLTSADRIPLSYQHALTWGGIRGAVSLALVIGILASVLYLLEGKAWSPERKGRGSAQIGRLSEELNL